MSHRMKKRCNGVGIRGCAHWDCEQYCCGLDGGTLGSVTECDSRGIIILCNKWKSIEEARIEQKAW